MEGNIGKVWLAIVVVILGIVVFSFGKSLDPVATKNDPFVAALAQLGILYIVALFVERSLEVIIKAWRQGGKVALQDAERSELSKDESAKNTIANQELQKYRIGTQKRALLIGLTMGVMVSVAGVRLLGAIFDTDDLAGFQINLFNFIDIVLTAGLIAGGSATIHELMALIDEFFRASRSSGKSR